MKRSVFVVVSVAAVVLAVSLLGCGSRRGAAPGTVTGTTVAASVTTDTTLLVDPPMGTIAITTTTGSGPATIRGRVVNVKGESVGPTLMHLDDLSERAVAQTYVSDSGDYEFVGLEPGRYRLQAHAWQTGYVSQWYGGLPVQTNPASDVPALDVGPGETRADFTLRWGRSVTGRMTQNGALAGAAWAEARGVDGQELPAVSGSGPRYPGLYLLLGLVPGRYKVLATDVDTGNGVWYGQALSAADASVVDVTDKDAAGIDIELSSAASTTSVTTEGATTTTSIWRLAKSSTSLEQLTQELEDGLAGTGVSVFVPDELPSGYTVAKIVDTLSGSTDNPAFWQTSGPRPGPRAAGYRVFFSNGRTWLRLDVNPPADHGNVQWKGTGTDWNGQELKSLEYPDSFWVRVPVPYDMVVEVWGPLELREELLSLASHISGVVQPAGS